MIQSQSQTLATEIEATVQAVPGVTAVFRAGGFVSKVVDAGAQILGIRDEAATLVQVEPSPQGPRIRVAIGVHVSESAAETSSRVHDAIVALCAEQHITPVEIHVTVVHIDTAPAASVAEMDAV